MDNMFLNSRVGAGFEGSMVARVAMALFVLSACTSDVPSASPRTVSLRSAVTGRAAAAIGADGLFRSATAAVQPGEISGSQAIIFADAWARDYAPMTRGFIENTHGAPVVFTSLRHCGRPLYARSPFVAAPSAMAKPYRRPYGSWWLITFCDQALTPTLSVAVSALATELSITDGKLTFPRISGNEFFGIGIPVGHEGEFPSSPELAVQVTAQQTGAIVDSPPDLVMPVNTDGPPQAARWHMSLKTQVAFKAAADTITTKEVYVGLAGLGASVLRTSVATRVQPDAVDVPWLPPPNIGELADAYVARMSGSHQVARILRRSDTPLRFETASLRNGQ